MERNTLKRELLQKRVAGRIGRFYIGTGAIDAIALWLAVWAFALGAVL